MNSIFTLMRVPSIVGSVMGSCRTLLTGPSVPHALSATPTPLITTGGLVGGRSLLAPQDGIIGGVFGRTKIRDHFPRPCDRKRILKHGWKARMSTRAGRRVLMRRILKGRFVYSH